MLKEIPDYGGLFRIWCVVKFKSNDGWVERRNALIDTGAHTTIIPLALSKEIKNEIIGEYLVKGLVAKEGCAIPVKVAWIWVNIVDKEGNETGELKIRTYLASTDEVPIIIGFKDLLEKFKLFIDVSERSGYIERANTIMIPAPFT